MTHRSAGAGRRAGRLAILLGAAALAAGAGIATSAPSDEKADVDQRLERARDRLEQARGREAVLTSEVAAYSERIRALRARLAPMRARSERLDAELAALQERLGQLTERLKVEKARLAEAEAELRHRQELLGRRLRDLYARGTPDPILVLMESGSLSAAIETTDLLEGIANRDSDLAGAVHRYRDETKRTRDAIAAMRTEVAESEARAERAAEQARAARAQLEAQATQVNTALGGRRALLSQVRHHRHEFEEETADLEARSAALAERIRAAQAATVASSSSSSSSGPSGSVATGAPSSSGMVWPVSGTLTSTFGPRWGRMHEGIDIAASAGTPIAAARGGTVIVAGWNGGYGNMVVVDHGGGLSTAYAHLSSIAVSVGQSVGQGTVVGGMGTTGNSTGVHLHFEVRVNGGAVNPLGYL